MNLCGTALSKIYGSPPPPWLKLHFFELLANIITRVPTSVHRNANLLMPLGRSEQYHERSKLNQRVE